MELIANAAHEFTLLPGGNVLCVGEHVPNVQNGQLLSHSLSSLQGSPHSAEHLPPTQNVQLLPNWLQSEFTPHDEPQAAKSCVSNHVSIRSEWTADVDE